MFYSDGPSTDADQKSSDIDHPASEDVSEEEDCSVPSSGSLLTDASQVHSNQSQLGRETTSVLYLGDVKASLYTSDKE